MNPLSCANRKGDFLLIKWDKNRVFGLNFAPIYVIICLPTDAGEGATFTNDKFGIY
jgi:hypothetical protein